MLQGHRINVYHQLAKILGFLKEMHGTNYRYEHWIDKIETLRNNFLVNSQDPAIEELLHLLGFLNSLKRSDVVAGAVEALKDYIDALGAYTEFKLGPGKIG